jgi:formate hydrogenlyase subunit 4
MNLLIGFIAQILHTVLMIAAAPLLVGIRRWLEARLAGHAGPALLQYWRDLRRLMRKETVLAESASTMSTGMPLISTASMVVAISLVPSFALGMTSASLADLLVIAGLFALARASLALAGMDAGTAFGGMSASRSMALAGISEPALLLVVFVLGLLAGSSNLDLVAAMQQETAAWRAGVSIAFAAMLLIALLDIGITPASQAHPTMRQRGAAAEFSAGDLALIDATDTLRLLLWFNLIGAMFLPFGMAPAGAGLLAWPLGLLCWVGRTLLFTLLLAGLTCVLGRLRLVRASRMAGVAVVLALLAALLLFADMGAA